ncbi:hypothetical protein LTR05_004097 [Lithohypha guttulata]|uniref:Uncharacterized protein n=1 Tax=Lithohypha guttulata TaxID=1690604 RepID=A0AAN7YHD1_9EURO|nr:hypothetical protein LTR05_004097 [Lithohypha guttulata]
MDQSRRSQVGGCIRPNCRECKKEALARAIADKNASETDSSEITQSLSTAPTPRWPPHDVPETIIENHNSSLQADTSRRVSENTTLASNTQLPGTSSSKDNDSIGERTVPKSEYDALLRRYEALQYKQSKIEQQLKANEVLASNKRSSILLTEQSETVAIGYYEMTESTTLDFSPKRKSSATALVVDRLGFEFARLGRKIKDIKPSQKVTKLVDRSRELRRRVSVLRHVPRRQNALSSRARKLVTEGDAAERPERQRGEEEDLVREMEALTLSAPLIRSWTN